MHTHTRINGSWKENDLMQSLPNMNNTYTHSSTACILHILGKTVWNYAWHDASCSEPCWHVTFQPAALHQTVPDRSGLGVTFTQPGELNSDQFLLQTWMDSGICSVICDQRCFWKGWSGERRRRDRLYIHACSCSSIRRVYITIMSSPERHRGLNISRDVEPSSCLPPLF